MLYIEDINPADVRCPPDKRSVSFGSRERNGLQLTVRRDGSVHWYFRYLRPDGRRNTLTLGYSDATLEEVRALRDEAAALLKRGIDPSQYKRKASRRAIEAQLAVGISVPTRYRLANVAAEWIGHIESTLKPGSVEGYRGALNRHVLPALGGADVRELTFMEIEAHIASLISTARQRNTLSTLRALLSYCVETGRTQVNVLKGQKALVKRIRVTPRRRVLTGQEIHRFLNQVESRPFKPELVTILQLQISSGLRIGEVAGLTWERIDMRKGEITHDRATSKAGAPTITVISDAMLRLLVSHHAKTGPNGRLFPEWANTSNLTKLIKVGVDGWIDFKSHDLRRTVSTHLQRLGCPYEIRRRIGNQISGSQLGQHYDHDFQTALQLQWLNRWGAELDALRINPNHIDQDTQISEERAALLAQLEEFDE